MEDFIRFQRTLMLVIAAVGLIAAGVLWGLLPDRWYYASGMVLGVIGGLLVYRMKVLAIYKFAQNPESGSVKSGFYGFVVMIAFLVSVIVINKLAGFSVVSGFTVLAGLILPNIVLMVYGFFCPQVPAVAGEEDSGEA